jgi:hypothetical protein
MAAPAGSLTLQPMTGPDVAAAATLSREQAWPHREEDWALFLEAGEGIVAQRAGRVLGTVMAWWSGWRRWGCLGWTPSRPWSVAAAPTPIPASPSTPSPRRLWDDAFVA